MDQTQRCMLIFSIFPTERQIVLKISYLIILLKIQLPKIPIPNSKICSSPADLQAV